ncbi:glycerol-3-phosphate 1-O-acyltransferase PlsY [Peptoniphilus catoniae]|uniref:glycerol-3-phosphate 1-O-acyltransferase PlsY n=1 Tax=Peptoniphilus catoniae TaxID=1660341 RepID=UPI0010FCF390|nr:glycerol-3-phosphate 1-O-acyltransferase PlsY [Peptoniphilus catoniae]
MSLPSLAIFLALSYLIGSISGSYLIGKIFLNKDIRKFGSGNAGTTNAMRTFGKKFGIATFIIDFLKGFINISLVKIILNPSCDFLILCALFCVLGHDFPFHMNFKGGKGVATTIGTLAVINFYLTLYGVIIWIVVVILTKIVSVGSMSFYISIVFLYTLFGNYSDFTYIILIIIASLGIFRHNTNLYRLIEGRENKIGVKRK